MSGPSLREQQWALRLEALRRWLRGDRQLVMSGAWLRKQRGRRASPTKLLARRLARRWRKITRRPAVERREVVT